jgi:hypothetical protein
VLYDRQSASAHGSRWEDACQWPVFAGELTFPCRGRDVTLWDIPGWLSTDRERRHSVMSGLMDFAVTARLDAALHNHKSIMDYG